MNLIGAHPLLVALAVCVIAILAGFTLALLRKPSNEGNWREHLARLAHVEMNDTRFSISNVKNWTFGSDGATEKSFTSFAADFADLQHVWFVVEPSEETSLIAHTLLIFEFTGGRLVAVTIEARLKQGEKWTPFSGLWNHFPLLYQWATARDVLTGRAVFLKHRVYIYPLLLQEAQMKSLLRNMLATTAKLEVHPRFYNTLFSNCTNELAKRAGLGWHYSFVLTGRASYQLFKRGVIPGASYVDAMRRADFDVRVKQLNALPPAEFDAALLAALRAD